MTFSLCFFRGQLWAVPPRLGSFEHILLFPFQVRKDMDGQQSGLCPAWRTPGCDWYLRGAGECSKHHLNKYGATQVPYFLYNLCAQDNTSFQQNNSQLLFPLSLSFTSVPIVSLPLNTFSLRVQLCSDTSVMWTHKRYYPVCTGYRIWGVLVGKGFAEMFFPFVKAVVSFAIKEISSNRRNQIVW